MSTLKTEYEIKTPAMQVLEQRYGRDIKDLIAESYGRLGSIRKVAAELGCPYSLVWEVIDRFGGEYRKWLTFPDRDAE